MRLKLPEAEAWCPPSDWGSLKAEARSLPSDWGSYRGGSRTSYFVKGLGRFLMLAEGFAYPVPDGLVRACVSSVPTGPRGGPSQNCTHALALPLPARPAWPWARESQPRCLRAPKGAGLCLGVKAALTECYRAGN